MVTKFKSKQDAEAFIRELEERYGSGVYYRIYKGHRHYCVQHNDMNDVALVEDMNANAKGVSNG